MMDCREATELMSRARDEKLTLGQRIGLRLHTLICAGCRRTGEQFELIGQLVRGKPQKQKNNSKTL
jgi:hypothetical protein